MDRLVAMFKSDDEKLRWVRSPVIRYLMAASDQGGEVAGRARGHLADLEKLDPETVERAKAYASLGALVGAPAPSTTPTAPTEISTTENAPAAISTTEKPAADGAAADSTIQPPAPKPVDSTGAPPAPVMRTAAEALTLPPADVPNRLLIVGSAIAVGVALFGALWFVLRGAGA
jgi:hypothetical protein